MFVILLLLLLWCLIICKFNLKASDFWNHYFPQGPYLVSEQEKSTTITNLLLPEDVLRQILARLPVKSLLRFRSVSRSWRDIMKEPTFITKHHLSQVALNGDNCVLARFSLDAEDFGLLEKDEQGGIKFTTLELPFFKDLEKWNLDVAGPCNGIVVISDGFDKLFLWNPATREYKAFPPSSQPSSLLDRNTPNYWWSCVGFGIDPRTKDYKVVRVWHFRLPENRDFIEVEVMSLSATNLCRPKSETWKIIPAVPPIYMHTSYQFYANGKYYWHNVDGIVWFDMGSELFGNIELLPKLCFHPCYEKLVVLKGSVMMMRHNCTLVVEEEEKYMYELLIINDDGRLTRYATVGPLMPFESPMGFWKNQELITLANAYDVLGYDLNFYDIDTNVIKSKTEGGLIGVKNLNHPFDLFDVYNESLISFDG